MSDCGKGLRALFLVFRQFFIFLNLFGREANSCFRDPVECIKAIDMALISN